MSDKRIWLRLSRGVSPELSSPIIHREVNSELVEDAPLLVTALKEAIRAQLGKHGRIPLDDGGEGE